MRFRELKKRKSNIIENLRIQIEPELEILAKPAIKESPKDHLRWSIGNLLVCFFLAIPAIVFSYKSRKNLREGDIHSAAENSRKARNLNIISDIIGFFIFIDLILFENNRKEGMCPLSLLLHKENYY